MTNITFWGVTASPFLLKMQALADYADQPWQRWPEQASRRQALGMLWRLRRARSKLKVQRFPRYVAGLDEYPAVPYYSFDGRQFYYDSTGLALQLDSMKLTAEPLVPTARPAHFLCRLIDEAFDEFGLYMAHHNRWVTSARTNVMAATTAGEMRQLLPPFASQRFQRRLAQRQVRRCPYLFSVAPAGFQCGMPDALTPPARAGFPPTHELLDGAWRRYLDAMESILARQPFLLGERFTLADASAFGQLSMNLVDGRAAELLQELAPRTFHWLLGIRDAEHRGSTGDIYLGVSLQPLLKCIVDTFVELMRQNEAAYREARDAGQSLFNEAAFDRGEALYEGSLLGMPFCAVVKTFQVAVWRDICDQWRSLQDGERQSLINQFPVLEESLFQESPA